MQDLTRFPRSPNRKRGGVTLRFPVYEKLPADSESLDLLNLETQHLDAQVVRGAAGYMAAEKRHFPHG